MRIISFGDIHMATAQIERLHGELSHADLVLVSGDLTNFGGKRQAAEVIGAIRAACPEVLAIPGNLDRPDVEEFLEQEKICLHGIGLKRSGLALVGCGGSNITPFHTPFELEEQEIDQLLKRGWKAVENERPLLMLCHTPPQGTAIDRLRDGRHVGSPAVRRFVEEARPQVCISGHVHEAAGRDRLGETALVNAGPLLNGGYIVVDLGNGTSAPSVDLRTL